MVAKKAKKTLFCYCHVGGEVIVGADKSVTYKGGRIDGIVIDQDTKFEALVGAICDLLHIPRTGVALKYSVKFDKSCLLPLVDQSRLTNFLQFNDDVGYVYVEQVGGAATPVDAATRCSNTETQAAADNCNEVDYNERNAEFFVGCMSREDSSLDVEFDDGDPVEHTSSEGQPPSVSPARSNPPPLMPEEWEKEIIGVGQEFPNRGAFKQALYKYSIAKSFRYKCRKMKPRSYQAKCSVESCPWRLTVKSVKDKDYDKSKDPVYVTRFSDKHKHSEKDQMKPLVKTKLMADMIKERMRSTPNTNPREIATDIASMFALPLTYGQSFHVKRKAKEIIHGKVADTYKLIPWMCERLMAMMPGTMATWESTEKNRFKQLFVAYHCSVRGFHFGCRPLLVVDQFKIIHPYKGILLSVSAFDVNNSMFPLAYGISASKDNVDWPWFFEKLKSLVGEVVIISDHNKSMLNVINKVFGAENHALSYRHLRENFKTFVHEQLQDSKKETALPFLDDIAYARISTDYDKGLFAMHRYNKELYDWVLANGPEHWANSQFRKKRWDNFHSDPADTFDSWMLNECDVQVFDFMRAHQQKLKELLLSRQRDVATWRTPVGTKIEKKIRENFQKAQGLVMKQVSDNVFEFPSQKTHIVDFLIRSCSCLEWQMTGIPCPHACSVLHWGNLDVYSYVDKCYLKDTQEGIYAAIMPTLQPSDMPTPDQITVPHLRSPNTLKPGRPRGMPVTCSECNQYGHNKKSCKNSSRCVGFTLPNTLEPGRPQGMPVVTCSICNQNGHSRKTCKNVR